MSAFCCGFSVFGSEAFSAAPLSCVSRIDWLRPFDHWHVIRDTFQLVELIRFDYMSLLKREHTYTRIVACECKHIIYIYMCILIWKSSSLILISNSMLKQQPLTERVSSQTFRQSSTLLPSVACKQLVLWHCWLLRFMVTHGSDNREWEGIYIK